MSSSHWSKRRWQKVGNRELEEGSRGEQLPCGPHYFPAVNFTCIFSPLCCRLEGRMFSLKQKEPVSCNLTKRVTYIRKLKYVVFYCLPGKVRVRVLFMGAGRSCCFTSCHWWPDPCVTFAPGSLPSQKPHAPCKHTHTHRFAQTSHPKLSPMSVLAGEVTLIRPNCSKWVQIHVFQMCTRIYKNAFDSSPACVEVCNLS